MRKIFITIIILIMMATPAFAKTYFIFLADDSMVFSVDALGMSENKTFVLMYKAHYLDGDFWEVAKIYSDTPITPIYTSMYETYPDTTTVELHLTGSSPIYIDYYEGIYPEMTNGSHFGELLSTTQVSGTAYIEMVCNTRFVGGYFPDVIYFYEEDIKLWDPEWEYYQSFPGFEIDFGGEDPGDTSGTYSLDDIYNGVEVLIGLNTVIAGCIMACIMFSFMFMRKGGL